MSDIDSLLDKIDSEGFDYAITEYGEGIKDEGYNMLRDEYLAARSTLANYLGIDA